MIERTEIENKSREVHSRREAYKKMIKTIAMRTR